MDLMKDVLPLIKEFGFAIIAVILLLRVTPALQGLRDAIQGLTSLGEQLRQEVRGASDKLGAMAHDVREISGVHDLPKNLPPIPRSER